MRTGFSALPVHWPDELFYNQSLDLSIRLH